jgi:hypothetical protein
MILSHLLIRRSTPAPRFAPGLFVGLIVAFAILGQSKPVFSLVGLGLTLVIAGVLVELNRVRIWTNYKKTYKKQKSVSGIWTKPNPLYYTINVAFLWPFVIFLGFIALWAAYALY